MNVVAAVEVNFWGRETWFPSPGADPDDFSNG